jgi:predicted nucleic acid-binding protein
MQVALNSSPIIFLSKLGYFDPAINLFEKSYVTKGVFEEISIKEDESKNNIVKAINCKKIFIESIQYSTIFLGLNIRIGKGEAETIICGIEKKTDFVILDDFSARKEALRLGLKVKGTLGIIKKLSDDKIIKIKNLNDLFDKLYHMNFRVRKDIFNEIFKN